MGIFSQAGIEFLLRWFHFLAGVTWIGLLYYFNFVQGEWFKETDAGTKSAAVQKLVPRALAWFRWSAMATFLTGASILIGRFQTGGGGAAFNSGWGVLILTGATLGTLMFLNVWLIIWPNQKIVIASAKQAASGGQALPNAAAAATKAGLASRTNVLFSIPMLFFMGAASHLGLALSDGFSAARLAMAIGAILLVLELNAIKGKTGLMTTVRGVIHCGVALTVVLYAVIAVLV